MKKMIASILFTLIIMISLFGCQQDEKVRVLLPSGTPLMAIGNLLDDDTFDFEICNGQDPLSAALAGNDYDLIIAPLNLGAKLYMSETSKYQFEAIITTNNTYIMSSNVINSIDDLSNEVVVTYGVGSTPWIALKAALAINNVTPTELSTQTSASDAATLFASGTSDAKYFLAAEPNITNLKVKKGLQIYTLDVSELLKEEVGVLIQACLFVNPDRKDSKSVKAAITAIENNIKDMNQNPEKYAKKIVGKNDFFTSLGENVLKEAIPNSNITFLKASENLDIINEYYSLLNTYNSNILSNSTPNNEFYG